MEELKEIYIADSIIRKILSCFMKMAPMFSIITHPQNTPNAITFLNTELSITMKALKLQGGHSCDLSFQSGGLETSLQPQI